jgi:hypothetical protein
MSSTQMATSEKTVAPNMSLKAMAAMTPSKNTNATSAIIIGQ